jgi:threonine/homoserine/homoserine lactone efflux protein
MAIAAVFGFGGLSLLLALTPGADWAYMIGAGLRQRSVLPAVAGLLAGYLVLTAVVAAGVAVLVAGSPMVLTVLTVIGAAYLIWLGAVAMTRPAGPVSETANGAGSWVRQTAKGVGTSGLNPKGLLLFLAMLPQFTNPTAAWSVPAQIMLLGLIHVMNCGIVYAGVGVGSRAVLSARPGWSRTVSRFSGAAMVVIAVVLLIEHFTA